MDRITGPRRKRGPEEHPLREIGPFKPVRPGPACKAGGPFSRFIRKREKGFDPVDPVNPV